MFRGRGTTPPGRASTFGGPDNSWWIKIKGKSKTPQPATARLSKVGDFDKHHVEFGRTDIHTYIHTSNLFVHYLPTFCIHRYIHYNQIHIHKLCLKIALVFASFRFAQPNTLQPNFTESLTLWNGLSLKSTKHKWSASKRTKLILSSQLSNACKQIRKHSMAPTLVETVDLCKLIKLTFTWIA